MTANYDSERLRSIRRVDQLIAYLRDELDWPIESNDLEEITYDFSPEELGIDPKNAAKIEEIKQLMPLETKQPWGIFFVKFEKKHLPVVALRRILGQLVIKKRQGAKANERPVWNANDLLFISSYGEGEERQITFAHFHEDIANGDLPTLNVLGWDGLDTVLHLENVASELKSKLHWPRSSEEANEWRNRWSGAFTLQHREVITTSKRMAQRLAELARGIRQKATVALSIENERGPLRTLMGSFKTALIHDLTEDDFADMYAQTIAYGLLTARISRPEGLVSDNITDMVPITNPFLKEMLETFLRLGGRQPAGRKTTGIDFDELGVNEVVQLLRAANMEAVIRDFGDRNPQEDPVIHFYELFLKEYDAKKRMKRGVFYTPRPVVSYIVRSVHELLQTEFGLEDGLADTATWKEMLQKHDDLKLPTVDYSEPNSTIVKQKPISPDTPFVQILDPATGTATFLVEVIDIIHNSMTEKWKKEGADATSIAENWNKYVPKHLLPRLHGYELMMAPYAIAHMKIGLKLFETGYKFGSDERARIFLTNALEPPQDFSDQFEQMVPALAHEAHAVNDVKRNQRFTVVIGNPPYARHSSNPSKGKGGQLTFIGRLVEEYKIDCPELKKPAQAKYLQDDYVKFFRFSENAIVQAGHGILGFITNHGFLDNPTFRGMRRHLIQSMIKTEIVDLHGNANKRETASDGSEDKNVFDIKQGVAIYIGLRPVGDPKLSILHADLYGLRKQKYNRLSHLGCGRLPTAILTPTEPQFILRPRDSTYESEYLSFTSIREIFSPNGAPAPGIVTTHDSFAVSFTPEEVESKVNTLLKTKSEKEAREHFRLCTQDQWKYEAAKKALADGTWREKIIPLYYRPLDIRYTVYDPNVAVHRRERVTKHLLAGNNLALLTSRMTKGESFRHVQVTRFAPEVICMSPNTSNNGFVFPLWLESNSCELRPDLLEGEKRVNLSQTFLKALDRSLSALDSSCSAPPLVTPEAVFDYIYSVLHSENFRTRYQEFLKSDFPRIPLPGSAHLFYRLVSLGSELVSIQLLESSFLEKSITTYIGPLKPEVGKVSYSEDTVWLDKNLNCGIKGVLEEVYNFRVGGYQVCEKWLKARKGRKLTADDIAHYQKIIVALSETIRLMKEIDEVIEEHGGWPAAFAQGNPQKAEPDVDLAPRDGLPSKIDDADDEPGLFQSIEVTPRPFEASPATATDIVTEIERKRTIDEVPQTEVLALIRKAFTEFGTREGADRGDALKVVSEKLGFDRVGTIIREELESHLRTAVHRRIIERMNGNGTYALATRRIEDYLMDGGDKYADLRRFLRAAISRAWINEDVAIRNTARYLGFARTGENIVLTLKGAINSAIRRNELERRGSEIRVTR